MHGDFVSLDSLSGMLWLFDCIYHLSLVEIRCISDNIVFCHRSLCPSPLGVNNRKFTRKRLSVNLVKPIPWASPGDQTCRHCLRLTFIGQTFSKALSKVDKTFRGIVLPMRCWLWQFLTSLFPLLKAMSSLVMPLDSVTICWRTQCTRFSKKLFINHCNKIIWKDNSF